jgi:uncharacterized protein YciI
VYMNPQDICFAIMLSKVSGRDTGIDTIARHIEYLRKLDDDSKLVLAGPFEDFPGGMVVVRAESPDAARTIAQSDPFVVEGVRTFEVRTWILATRENGYLG